jgi:nucleotide-binding universal stress UspA family protein
MYQRILAPVDGSDTSARGLHEAIRLARGNRSTLRFIYVVTGRIYDHAYDSEQYPSNYINALRSDGMEILSRANRLSAEQGVASEDVMVDAIGEPAAGWIVTQSKEWEADLIVMGTHGRRGFRRTELGADAEEVLRAAAVPVLLIRGFVLGA